MPSLGQSGSSRREVDIATMLNQQGFSAENNAMHERTWFGSFR